jgi:signal transduction histidine kinase
MAILFLSTKVGLIALLPNIFPILVNFGLMGLLGIPLSVATSLIASIVIGLAVDDTIHYMVRYNAEFKRDLDKDRAMRDTVFHTGRPILFSSFTIGLGFAVLILSHFQPTAVFGLLMVVTMSAALLGDLILLPILMMHVELVTAWDLLKSIPLVGRISSGMVHELNQPLNAIKVGSDFLRMMAKRGAPVGPQQLAVVSQEIGDQVARASDIIHRFSEVALLNEHDKGLLQINVPIHETVGLLANQIKLDNISLQVDLADPLPPIAASHGRMVQVLCHLLQNAWDAIVEKKKHDTDEVEHRIAIQASESQGQIVVMVIDTGTGIPGYHLDRIFEPFFTTRSEGQGKGLGLTVVQQIVRDLGGRIGIDSQLGRGTTMTLTFPIPSPSPDSNGACVNHE